jgi:hypothetical protein
LPGLGPGKFKEMDPGHCGSGMTWGVGEETRPSSPYSGFPRLLLGNDTGDGGADKKTRSTLDYGCRAGMATKRMTPVWLT